MLAGTPTLGAVSARSGVVPRRCQQRNHRPESGAVPRRCQQRDHLVVVHLAEAVVVAADGVEQARHDGAYDLIGDEPKVADRPLGADGYGDHGPRRSQFSRQGNRRLGRGAGREPVIHQDCDFAGEIERWPAVPVRLDLPIDLDACARRDPVGLGHAQVRLRLDGPDIHAVRTDRTERHLRRPGQAELADHEYVEWSVDLARDRCGDRDTATRDAEHPDRRPGPVRGEEPGDGHPGIGPIDVSHPSLIRRRPPAARLARMIGPGSTVAGTASARIGRVVASINHARGGLVLDVVLYGAGALFAGLTAANASLPPHRAWGHIAVWGYAAATLVAVLQAVAVRRGRLAGTSTRALVTAITFVATAVLPMLVEAVQRAGGRLDRAQEEVGVVEAGGVRLWHTGTPYLSHDAIAALPPGLRLDAYLPYQPVMAVFGLPRAIGHAAWWTDARVWFTITLVITLAWSVGLLRRNRRRGSGRDATTAVYDEADDVRDAALVRAVQAATVFPICALTIATGGDDMPVLGLTLLALAFAARGRHTAAGVTIGIAGALKLFAWPVAVILIVLAAADGWRRRHTPAPGSADLSRSLFGAADWSTALRCAAGAIGIPVLVLIPPFIVNRGAAIENVIRFPLGHGIVKSPAASPFPGHLIADNVPGGATIATALLVLAALAIAGWLVGRPPTNAGAAAAIAAWSLVAAIALIPSTRFGYLLYPVAYVCWVPALRRPTVTAVTGRHPTAAGVVVADPAAS